MLYGLVALFASLALGVRYVFHDEATIPSQVVVGATVLVSLGITGFYPSSAAVATALQAAAGIHVLLYLKMRS